VPRSGPKNFDPEDRTESRRQHLRARLDRHPENIGHARHFEFLVHLGDDFFPRHAGPPLFVRLERDHCFEHRERRGIGRCLRLTGFAENGFHFVNLPQQTVLDLEDFSRSPMDIPGTAVGMK